MWTKISNIITAVFLFSILNQASAFETGAAGKLNRLYWSSSDRNHTVVNGEHISSVSGYDFDRYNSIYLTEADYDANFGFGFASSLETDIEIIEVDNNGASPVAQIFAILFNDGTGSAPGDGDIFVSLQVTTYDDGDTGPFRGALAIFRCLGETCDDGETLLYHDTDLGEDYSLGQKVRAIIEWDGTDLLTFSIDGNMHQVDITTLGITAAQAPHYKFAGLRTAIFGIDDRRDFGHIKGAFDNVVINGFLLDDFSSNMLGPIWATGERRNEVGQVQIASENGKLFSNLKHSGVSGRSSRSNNASVARPNSIDYLESELTIKSINQIGDARVRARLTGFWFNDGNVNNGETGEVQAEIRIIDRPGQGFVAEYFTFRCDDEFCNTGTDGVFNRPSAWVPVVGQKHKLSIKQMGADFEFCFDGICETVASGFTNATPSNANWKAIGTRVDSALTPADSASIEAEFENIKFSNFPTFTDVSTTNQFLLDVEKLVASGVTGGCGGGEYCPLNLVTRGQMAVFIERALTGHFFTLPPATGTLFNDVPASDPFAPFIEQFSIDGITSGCAANLYCPLAVTTRAQMAVFLLRVLKGADFQPPEATGTVFTDVPKNFPAAAWIEEFSKQGITGGCGGGKYCPNDSVSREQMAAFLVRTFNL